MSNLQSYISSDFFESYNALLPRSHVKTITVYVEGLEDIAFWKKVFSPYERKNNLKFEITHYSDDKLTTGKAGLQKLFANTGEFLLICLDSDYDYLLPQYSDNSVEINDNPFIFQTYAYSIENLKCFSKSLEDVCVEISHRTDIDINFVELLTKYSKIIYDLFIWNLYFYKIGRQDYFTVSDFSKIISFENNLDLDFDEVLERLSIKVNDKLEALKINSSDFNQVKLLSKELKSFGLIKSNAYLFVNGHIIFDHVVLFFVKRHCKSLKDKFEKQIIENSNISDVQRGQEKRKYRNLVGNIDNKSKEKLSYNSGYKDCFLYKKIKGDVKSYIKLTK